MIINPRLAVTTAAIASILSAAAIEVGTEVQLSETIMGRVITGSSTNHTVAVYANPDNKPSGVFSISAVYFKGDDTFTVTYIDEDGFKTTDVQFITAPATLVGISKNAFYGCTKLRRVHESDRGSITTIGESAFDFCYGLTTFDYPGLEYLGNFACRRTGLTSVELPAIKTIGAGAFHECQQLETVVIGESCTSIGNIAFCKEPELKSVTVPYGVREIGAQTFGLNVKLNEIVVPYTLEKAGRDAYFGSAWKRVFILSPDFMDYCDLSGLLRSTSLKEIYCLPSLADAITRYLNNGEGDTTPESTSSATVKTVDDLLRVDNLPAARTSFKLTPMIEGITDIKVYTAAGGTEILPVDGVYTLDGTEAFLSYKVNGFNHLSYPVEGLGYTAAVSGIEADATDAPAELYDLNGRRADSSPAPGVYIRKQGTAAEKVLVR